MALGVEPKRASRREWLKFGALAAVSSLFPAASSFAATRGRLFRVPPGGETEPALLYRSTFLGQLNQSFGVRQPVGRPWVRTVTLRLVEVEDVPSARAAGTEGREDCFTAVFSGPARTPLAQGTYAVKNGSLGRFPLFLVPGSVSGTQRFYTATFNRALPS
jgi:hypothetical protein